MFCATFRVVPLATLARSSIAADAVAGAPRRALTSPICRERGSGLRVPVPPLLGTRNTALVGRLFTRGSGNKKEERILREQRQSPYCKRTVMYYSVHDDLGYLPCSVSV